MMTSRPMSQQCCRQRHRASTLVLHQPRDRKVCKMSLKCEPSDGSVGPQKLPGLPGIKNYRYQHSRCGVWCGQARWDTVWYNTSTTVQVALLVSIVLKWRTRFLKKYSAQFFNPVCLMVHILPLIFYCTWYMYTVIAKWNNL